VQDEAINDKHSLQGTMERSILPGENPVSSSRMQTIIYGIVNCANLIYFPEASILAELSELGFALP